MGCWLGLRALKTLYFHFCKAIKKNWKDFCKEFFKKLWKKNSTWNIRRLVNETIVPSTQQPSVLYWRFLDLWTFWSHWRKLLPHSVPGGVCLQYYKPRFLVLTYSLWPKDTQSQQVLPISGTLFFALQLLQKLCSCDHEN